MMPRLASVLALVLASSSAAWADTITLDSGAVLQGDLARFEFGGDCQISVTEGDLNGVIVIVPCHRVASFVRTSPRMPVAIGVVGGGGDPAAAPAAIEAQAAARAVTFGAAAPAAAAPAAPAPAAAAPVAASAPSTARMAPAVETEAIALSPSADAPTAAAPASEGAAVEEEPAGFFEDLLGASPFDAEPDPESPAALPAPSIVANGPQPIADVNARTTTPSNQPRAAPAMEEPAAAPAEPPASRAVSF